MTSMRAVAIDGPAGAGKSTIARRVASELGFLYVDTGAMYRAVALKAIRTGVDLEDETAMGNVAACTELRFSEDGTRILLDGEDVSTEIRSPEVTRNTRYSARAKPVREALVEQQRRMARNRPVVMEGRDITTVVLAEAKWKFFLTAGCEERARRRYQEMREAGHEPDFDQLLQEIRDRDASDSEVGPLRKAQEISARPDGDIVAVDTTEMTPDDVVHCIVRHVRASEGVA